MQFDSNLTGPDFLEAVAEAELHNGNEINAAVFRAQAKRWREDQAALERVDPNGHALLAEAKARIAILEAKQASATAALAA
jgi:hypothetical protein